MKKLLAVLLTAVILMTVSVVVPLTVGAQEPADTVTYEYTFNMTVTNKFCAIRFRVDYDTDIYTFEEAAYPGFCIWDPVNEEYNAIGAFIAHDKSDPNEPIDWVTANSANATDVYNFTKGKAVIKLKLSCAADAPVKVPTMKIVRIADSAIAQNDHGQSLPFSWNYTFGDQSGSGSFEGGVIPASGYVVPAESIEVPTEAPTEAPTAAPTEAPTDPPAVVLPSPTITAFENTAAGVKLTWTASEDAQKFRVFWKNGTKWTKVGDTTANSIVYKTKSSGTKYTFTVRCLSADGTAYASTYNTKGWTTTFIAAPTVTKFENTAAGVKLTLGKPAGAAKLRVFVKNGAKWVKVGDTTANSIVYKTNSSGTKYTFTVRCLTADAKKYASAFNTAGWSTVFVATPAAPTLKNTKNGVQITWKRVAGAASYRIFRKIGSGKWAALATTNKAYVDKTARNGVTYRYTIRCLDKNGRYVSAYNNGTAIKCVR